MMVLGSHITRLMPRMSNGALVKAYATVYDRSIMQAYVYFVLGRTSQSRGRSPFTASTTGSGITMPCWGSSQNLRYQESLPSPRTQGGVKFYKWAYDRREMRNEKYWEQYYNKEEQFYNHPNKFSEKENINEERDSFGSGAKINFPVSVSDAGCGSRIFSHLAALMLCLTTNWMQDISLVILFAWTLGGRGGILLTILLSFASWVCGKTSSGVVTLVSLLCFSAQVFLARHTPLPQGALPTLLCMSIKLQVDLK